MKYKEWLKSWLEIYVLPYVKDRTLKQYNDIVFKRLIPELGEFEVEELNLPVLQKYISGLSVSGNKKTGGGLTPNSIYGIISVIRCSVSMAQVNGMEISLDFDKIKRPKRVEKNVSCFTADEQKLIERAILNDDRYKMFGVIICLYTGLRIGEVLALEWSDVDFEAQEICVSKTCYDGFGGERNCRRIVGTPKTESSNRIVPIPTRLVPYLQKLKLSGQTTNVVSDGKKVPTVRSYQRSFEVLQRKLNIAHHGFHALRHTFATRALECGMDVKTLSEILGHRSPTVTLNRYAHSLSEHKREMMNRVGLLL